MPQDIPADILKKIYCFPN